MKFLVMIGILIVMGFLVLGCNSKKKTIPIGAKTEELVLKVGGMTCGGCEHSVKKALLNLEGVVQASADHKKGEAKVTIIEGKVTSQELLDAVNKTGYKALSVEK